MKIKYLLAASVVSLSAAATIATPAAAQQITSGVEGRVNDADGNALPGATVTITDTRTQSTRTLTAGGSGAFNATGLVAGGPYTITATAPGFEGQTLEGQTLSASGSLRLTFGLTANADGSVIVVTGARVQAAQVAVGPGQIFDLESLEGFPSITRNVVDIIRLDPRVSLDRNNEVDRISCLGGNDRSNTFTVDGVVQSDVFGLNGTPTASRNTFPIPFDTIRQTSVEFAPFDVEYSDFTGCAINVVTKSGENKFHGSAFFTFTNDNLRGDSAGSASSQVSPFEDKRWGATLGGPIIKDRLFFYAGYEETDLGRPNDFGPTGGGFAVEADFVTQDQFDEFARIARDVYGQDVGGYPTVLNETSVRYFGRVDAYLTDDHRLEATYQRLEETKVESDTGTDNLTGLNSFEDEGTISDYYSVRLYSDWTDRVSTEIRLSRAEVGDKQGPFGFGEAQSDNPTVRLAVAIEPVAGATSENGLLSTGPGIFRSANQLDTQIDQARFVMNIDADDHQIKLGAEVNDLSVFNLFAINATGTIFFRGLDDFANGLVASGSGSSAFASPTDVVSGGRFGQTGGATIASSATGDINDASATFSRQIYSFYAQDQWQATDQLNLTAGVRVQLYDGSGIPRLNPLFQNRFGFSNSVPFSALDPVVLPRFAATYDMFNEGFFSDTTITGGIGVFSGGDPVVFFSNAFSNDGFASANGDSFDSECDSFVNADGSFNVVSGGQFTGLPQCVVDAAVNAAANGRGDIKSTDPDFKVPTVVRANFGIDTMLGTESGFFSNWNLRADYIYSRFRNTLGINDLVQVPDPSEGLNGFTIDGRPIIAAIDPLNDGCNAQLVGTGGVPPVYTGVTDECFGARIDDFNQLTNGRSYDSHVASFALSKRFDGGLITDNGSVNLSLGYAFTDSNNTRNFFGATANGNFEDTAAFDFQDPAVSTSNFETRHRFTVAASFQEQFIEDYDTQLAMFFSARSGRPYSLTFSGDGFQDSTSGDNNALLYIPTGPNDPNISPSSSASAEDITNLVNFVDNLNCDFTPGETIRRNTCSNDWVYDMDLRFSQELPGFGRLFGVDDKFELFADFDNVLNFIDSDWNVFRNRDDEDGLVDLIDADGVDAEGRYIFEDLNTNSDGAIDDQERIGFSNSVWRIQVGVRYEF
ncbi:MAG: carboxypeptidase regulatory-like domain-containing protein [Erythrobacter sp.]